MPVLFWAFLAATIAASLEVAYRHLDTWPVWAIIPGTVLTYALYRTINGGPTFLLALVAFSAFTLMIRTSASVFIFHEPLVRGNLLALGAFMVAMLGKYWR